MIFKTADINKNNSYILKCMTAFLITAIFCLSSCGIFKKSETAVSDKHPLSEEQRIENSALFIDAFKESMLGNDQKAMEMYGKCIKEDPSNAAAMFELSKILGLRKNYKEALVLAQRAVKTDPDNPWYQQLLASLYMITDRYNEAADVYENLSKKHPENVGYLIDWANAYIYGRNISEAIKVFDIIESKMGITEEISIQKEKLYLSLKKSDKAIEELQKLISKFPDESKYYNLLAELYFNNSEYDKAFEIYNKILEIAPDDPYVHLALSQYYKVKGDKEKSFEEMELAFKNKKFSIDSKVAILIQYYTALELSSDSVTNKEALALSEILSQSYPNDAKSHSIHADLLYRDKKVKDARDEYRKVIALDSSKYLVWEQLLRIEAELNDTNAMADESKTAIELFPLQPVPYFFSGVSEFNLKKYDEAIDAFKKGAEITVDNNALLIWFYTYLGDAYHQKANNSESDKAYEKVLELDSKNSYVLNNYSYFLSERGENLEGAEKMAKKANELEPDNSSYLDTYAWVLYKMGRLDEAKKWSEKSMENGGKDNADILEHYGDILYKLNDVDNAYNYWLKAKEAGEGSKFLEQKIRDKKLYE